MLKSYMAYTSRFYRWMMLLVYPLTAFLCCLAMQTGFFGIMERSPYQVFSAQDLMVPAVCVVEIFMDYFGFCGIQVWEEGKGRSLRIAGKGPGAAFKILLADQLRRFLVLQLLFLGNIAMSVPMGSEPTYVDWIYAFQDGLWCFCVSSVLILGTRFFFNILLNIIFAAVSACGAKWGITALMWYGFTFWQLSTYLILGCVCLAVCMIFAAMQLSRYRERKKKIRN